MAGSFKVFETYIKWKEGGIKRRLSEDLANYAGITIQTLYRWAKKPITIGGIKYSNWEEAYQAETQQLRDNFKAEIDAQLKEDYRLSDILANEILMKYIIKVKGENYIPSLEELKIAVGIQDKKRDSVSNNKDIIDGIEREIGFR